MNTLFAVTLDPLHIGAGGYRLGRVDNTIVRDAGSGLPKVPGSSLAGVARSYLVHVLEGEEKKQVSECLASSETEQNSDQEQKDKKSKGNCGKCLACRLFGYASTAKQKKSHIGLLRFYDGNIIAFPVKTIAGPMWLTSPSALALVLDPKDVPVAEDDKLIVNGSMPNNMNKTNIGWLYINVASDAQNLLKPLRDRIGDASQRFARLALAPDWLFAELVNSNLEVRTSVSIDPLTGAAEEGKLFTYEAIPTATLLAFDVDIDEARCIEAADPNGKNPMDPAMARELLNRTLTLCGVLGMGGMCTRGFGRVRFLGEI